MLWLIIRYHLPLDDYVDVSHSNSLIPDELTIAFWLKSPGCSYSYLNPAGIIGKDAVNAYGFRHSGQNGHTSKIYFYILGANVLSTTVFNDNIFHFVVGTWNGTTSKLYVDGVQEGGDTSISGTLSGTGDLIFGARQDLTYPFDGTIDEVRILDVALTAEQIEADYAATKGMFGGNKFEYYNSGDVTQYTQYDVNWHAQTFTPATAHKITSVRLKLFKGPSDLPGTYTVSIRATDGSGHPTGADLCSGTINGNSLTENTAGLWYEITLGGGCDISADTKYAIVARASSGDSSNYVQWRADNSSPTYAGGSFEYSTDSGSSWGTGTTVDFMFEEYGDNGATPVLDEISVDFTSWTPRPPGVSPSGGGFMIF